MSYFVYFIYSPFVFAHEMMHLIFMWIFRTSYNYKFFCDLWGESGSVGFKVIDDKLPISKTQRFGMRLCAIAPFLLVAPWSWAVLHYITHGQIFLFAYVFIGILFIMPSKADIQSFISAK